MCGLLLHSAAGHMWYTIFWCQGLAVLWQPFIPFLGNTRRRRRTLCLSLKKNFFRRMVHFPSSSFTLKPRSKKDLLKKECGSSTVKWTDFGAFLDGLKFAALLLILRFKAVYRHFLPKSTNTFLGSSMSTDTFQRPDIRIFPIFL